MKRVTVKIKHVFESVTDDNDGRRGPSGIYYETSGAALEASKSCTWAGNGHEPVTREVVVFPDGEVFLITPIAVYSSNDDADKKVALAKLSPRKRMLLGLSSS